MHGRVRGSGSSGLLRRRDFYLNMKRKALMCRRKTIEYRYYSLVGLMPSLDLIWAFARSPNGWIARIFKKATA